MAEVIGECFHKQSECTVEWRILDFLSLPKEIDKVYISREFFFAGARWELLLYPNGESRCESEEGIGLYLSQKDLRIKDSVSPVTVGYSLGVRKADGTEEIKLQKDRHTFDSEESSWGLPYFLTRKDLLDRRAFLAPSEVLTITCTIKIDRLHSVETDLSKRLWNNSVMLKRILKSREGTDVTLKLEDGELHAHKMILKGRSEVFDRMFNTDMKEVRTGEVNIPDANRNTFNVVLNYIYSGEPHGLSPENMCSVYKIAHKYALEELQRLCLEFMKECLSLETVCDIIDLTSVYEETVLKDQAREFFVKNVEDVVKTDKWRTLKKEIPAIVSELLEQIIVDNISKIKH